MKKALLVKDEYFLAYLAGIVDSDMLYHQLPNFFQTTFQYGLTDEIALAVIEHLNA